jgi:general secretion pathway protein F
MPQFTYKAKVSPHQVKSGIIQADTALNAARKIREEGLYPVSVSQVHDGGISIQRKRIQTKDIIGFTRQLANLVHAGFPLTTALSTLSAQERNISIKKLIDSLHAGLQKGSSFSQTLSAYPALFSSVYISMVRIGETTGTIDQALNRLADFKEREGELVAQIRSALVYPVFVLVVGLLTVFFMLTFFIPKISGIFSSMGQSLPAMTRIVMNTSSILSHWWGGIVIICVFAFFIIRHYYKKEYVRVIFDEALLTMPMTGAVIIKLETARLCYALGVLLKNNVPVLAAIDVLCSSTDNRFIRSKLRDMQNKIRKGSSLSSCLEAEKIFPAVLINIVAVGEESGSLDEMLEKSAQAFEKEINRDVKTIVSLLEPALILFVGGLVMILVFSMLIPVFQMNLTLR